MKTCKHCTEPRYQSKNLCREHNNEYYREYRKNNLEKVRAIHRISRMKQYYRDERERMRTSANSAVQRAMKNGRLKIKPCKKCGKEAQAHHSSYKKEDWLKVTWLCVEHHSEWHRNNEPTY